MEEQKPWYKKGALLAGLAFAVIGGLVFFIAMHLAAMKP
jgi:hypothetical protein